MIHLFVSDIDGCLAEPYQPFDHAALGQLARFNKESKSKDLRLVSGSDCVPVSICSGRSYPYVEAMTQVLGLHMPVLYGAGGGLFFPLREIYQQHPSFDASTRREIQDLVVFLENMIEGHALQIDYAKQSQAGLMSSDPREISWAKARISAYVAEHFPAFNVYSTPVSVDVVPSYMTKQDGLEWLCSTLGISMSNVAFIGDTDGDIDALRAVGRSYAPANACEEVKTVVDVVTENPVISGVLEAYADVIAFNERVS